MAQPLPRDSFKAPEGEYTLYHQTRSRSSSTLSRACRLTLAQAVVGGRTEMFVVCNSLDFVYITLYAKPDTEPARSIYCGSAPGRPSSACSSHAHEPQDDGIDLLLGLKTGDVLVTSLAGQVESGRLGVACLHLNHSNAHGNSQVVGVVWLPGGRIAAAHQSGSIHIYQKRDTGSQEKVTTHLKSIVSVPGGDPVVTLKVKCAVTALAAQPGGGAHFAAACADGRLRIWDSASLQLVAGFRSYYGGLCCCAWSPDGAWVAAGGEDDLVALYSLRDRAVVAWGGGHASWVSAVTFDPYVNRGGEHRGEDLLRVVSGGQDCQVALWDFDVSSEALSPSTPRSAVTNGGTSFPRAGSGGGCGSSSVIAPSVPHADMDIQPPIRLRKVMGEPISSVLAAPDAIFMAGFSGAQRVWKRPTPTASAAAAAQHPSPDPRPRPPSSHSRGRAPGDMSEAGSPTTVPMVL
mmetsp:Transcript_13525/g.40892  ORF Transcript_13525/g.40892 Transcript_13525/m.40892 type:complete len:461 (-) Transcript_13525:3788-5170(-)